MSIDLHAEWVNGTLTREQVQAEVYRLANSLTVGGGHGDYKEYTLSQILSDKDLQHIGYCLHKLYLWYRGVESVGPFLQAIIDNDLTAAYRKADSANWIGLSIYLNYLHNEAPATWRSR